MKNNIALYVITYNFPKQLLLLIDSFKISCKDFLGENVDRFLLNNSTDESVFIEYSKICREYNFVEMRNGNKGISGGRSFCAEHFYSFGHYDYLIWFEDDMLLYPPKSGLCKNGFSKYVPNLLNNSIDIVNKENIDFLKFSFTEFYGDHHENWAWYNMGNEEKKKEFPNHHKTEFRYSGSCGGISYLLGNIFYSNWPSIITKDGNKKIFLGENRTPMYEQIRMRRVFYLNKENIFKSAVLLASPINHNRVYHYDVKDRKEI